MKSLNTSYFTRIDHLRFFAAILVVFHHLRGKLSLDNGQWTMDILANIDYFFRIWLINGSTGVSLFLFLTGFLFCIISGYGEKKIRYSGFIYNRILRIFPMMTLMVFIIISINRQHSTPMDIFRILTLQLNTGHPYTGWGHEFFPSGPIWTIAVEFQFYLLFPFLALFLSKYGVRYLVALVVFMIMLRFNINILTEKSMYSNFYHSILGRLDQFLIGMIFAVAYNRGYLKLLQNRILSLVVVVFSILVLMYLFSFDKGKDAIYLYYSFTIEAICWGVIAIAYLSINLPKIKWLDLGLAKLGEISFSIYLLHLPISAMLNKFFNIPNPTTVVESLSISFVKSVAIILISLFTFYLIERPFMSLRVKYTQEN